MNLTGGMPSPPTVTPGTCSVVSAAIVVTRPLFLPAFAERLFRLLAVKVRIPMTCVQVLVRSDISISRGHAASPVSPQASRSFFVTSKEETSHQQNTHARCFPMGAASSRNQGEMISESGGRIAAFVGLVKRQRPSAIRDQLSHFYGFPITVPTIPAIRVSTADRCCISPTTSYPSWLNATRSHGLSLRSAISVPMPENRSGQNRSAQSHDRFCEPGVSDRGYRPSPPQFVTYGASGPARLRLRMPMALILFRPPDAI